MTELLHRIFLANWPRKLVALSSAIVIWFLVNQSVTVTKTFSNIPVRIINLPPQKTVVGMMHDQFLNKRISLTLTGEKEAVEELDSSEIEVTINVEGKLESFIAKIDKKNLTLPTREESLKNRISDVSSNDLFVKISNLVNEEIPLTISTPLGESPAGFQFLDISPKSLVQKVSGAEEEITELKKEGLTLTFDLQKISKEELETIKSVQAGFKSDEISFFVPASWKKIPIPFLNDAEEPLNDPRAQYLRIDFLKQELLKLDVLLPITLFFAEKNSTNLNPETIHLAKNHLITEKNGLYFLNIPLFASGVSRQFLNVVQDHMTLAIAVDTSQNLPWTVLFIDIEALEKSFIEIVCKEESMYGEDVLKERFNRYIKTMKFYTKQNEPLKLTVQLNKDEIQLEMSGNP